MAKNDIKAAVLLINMGGPENPEEIPQFMRRLFNDPHIMNVPSLLRPLVARIITRVRLSRVRDHYQQIGGASPLKGWTKLQGEAVLNILLPEYPHLRIVEAYSYSDPTIEEAIMRLESEDLDLIVALPLYPQYSAATLGSIYAEVDKARKKIGHDNRLKIIKPFFKHTQYIAASVDLLAKAMKGIKTEIPYHVIFSAHALPQSFIDRGDPYKDQIEKTVSLILEKYPIANSSITYQSKIGPVKWMEPSTIETAVSLAKRGVKQLVIMPVGFVCDHIETLYELDIELASIARSAGIEKFIRVEVFNTNSLFIGMLADLIRTELQ